MTERKPPNVTWESWIDSQIRQGMERGEFDALPGKGRPIRGLDQPYDELWWVRDKLRREGVSYLPPTLAIRKDVEDALAAIGSLRDEAAVRRVIGELNVRIRHINSHPTDGPPSTMFPLDVDEVVGRWRAQRGELTGGSAV